MTAFVIYKQIFEKKGIVKKVEIVEVCPTEQDAVKFSKLYNLQIPSDLKDKFMFSYIESALT